MKGVLFSADFVEDNSGNYRILELNTDTGFISSSINTTFDFTELKQLISDNNITTVETVAKAFHSVFIDKFEQELSGTDVTTFTKHVENLNTIYPEQITDASDKLILRLAYDDGALFDTEYCKERINLLTLFHANDDTGSIPAFYHSGSSQTYNTLVQEELNDHSILPDFVQKRTWEESGLNVGFYKGGNNASSSVDRVNDIVDNYIDKDNYYAEKFYYNNTQITNSDKVESIRTFNIAYWNDVSDIDTLQLSAYKIQAVTELPSAVALDDYGYAPYDKKHYHEFATNWPTLGDLTGFKDDGRVFNMDNSTKLFKDIAQNDIIKGLFISGSPITDNLEDVEAWKHTGDTLPDFYVTASVVENMMSASIGSGIIAEVKLSDDESLYSGLKQHYLVHEASSNEWKFKWVVNLDKDDDCLVDHSGSKVDIIGTNILMIEEQDLELYNPDVEEQDIYIVSASSPLIVHNAPCFIAGTKVRIEEKGITNIEDVVVGDKVASYNHDNDSVEYNEVLKVRIQEDKEVVTYVFENGTKLSATPDHPLFVFGKDYSSYNPEKTKEDSGLDVRQIAIGDKVLHMEGLGDDEYGVIIEDIIEEIDNQTVYNLEEVAKHHNFFVEDLLAHNRMGLPCCFKGTAKVQLQNGEFKEIKDIEIGDMVYSYHTEYSEQTDGEVTALHNTTKLSDHVNRNKSIGQEGMGFFHLNDERDILFTPEHPWLTKEGWKALAPDSEQEPFVTEQESKKLELGDFVFSLADGWVEVYAITFVRAKKDELVYNITIKDTHTYTVGGYVVHNK